LPRETSTCDGMDIRVVEEILGHSTLAVAKR
jgi:hypothetical protein